jgi:hypothetical protein
MEKKGKAGIIIIIVLLLAIAGVSSYFIFFRDSRAIEGFTYEVPSFNAQEICDYYDEYAGDICVQATDSVVYYSDGETDDVILFEITKGFIDHKSMLESSCEAPNQCEHIRDVFIFYPNGPDRPTFLWYYEEDKFLRIKQWGDNSRAESSKVIKHYLDKYPQIQI